MGKSVEFLDMQQRAIIAAQCFQVDTKSSSDSELRGHCPFHQDKNPSFSYNIEKDVYNCLGCGAKGDLISLWSHSKGFDNTKGFAEFYKEFNPNQEEYKTQGKEINCVFLQKVWEMFPPLPEDFIRKMIKERTWTREGIEALDLRLQTMRWDKKLKDVVPVPAQYQNKIAIAVRDGKGKIQNIRFYQPGAKEFKLISFAPGLGQARLFPEPSTWDNHPVWIVEGEPDVICAVSHGINATTQTAGAGTWKRSFSELFKGRDVVICYDADGKGIRGAEKTGEQLSKVADSVKIIRWPDFMGKVNGTWPEAGGQDLTDWFARHRKTKKELFELLIEATEIECSRNKLESVERFFPQGTFKPALLAKEIMEEWELASDPLAGLLYRWNGQFWEEFDSMFIRQKALRILGTEGDSSRVSNVTTQVIDLSLLPFGTEMNKAHEFMCVENGMLNIYENKLYPHEQDYFCSCMINTHYDPYAKCDKWENFLSETVQDPDTIKVLQEFAGYILTPDVSHEKALLLYGKGSDGKSTFVNVLKSLVGEHACGAVSLENLEDQYYRATLHNKFLNICTETEGSIFYSGMFKAIVSGDTISAAHKNKKPFDFAPTIKMIYAFNRWPKVMDNTDAFYRRLLTVRFKRQFKGKDKTLGLDKILLKELPGILNWALEGLARLRKQKSFTDSADINNTLISYMFENNPVMGFVYDMCRTEPEYSGEEEHMYTRQDVLYPKYRSFCSKCGFHPLNLNSFSRELRIICPKIEIKRIGSREGRYKVFTNIAYVGADNE